MTIKTVNVSSDKAPETGTLEEAIRCRGRELRFDDLKLGQVVVVKSANQPLVTLNVTELCDLWLGLSGPRAGLHFRLKRLPDGRVTDRAGTDLTLFEFKGDV